MSLAPTNKVTSVLFKSLSILCLVLFSMPLLSCQAGVPVEAKTIQEPPSHAIWTSLLQEHVQPDGLVDYKGFIKDRQQLNAYLTLLQAGVPDPDTWTKEERLAYWINAYNAFTVKLIIDNYPLKSIKDLNSTLAIPTVNTIWDQKFFKLGGAEFSLNMIEHEILRKEFKEPRIHFAINCASISCPALLQEAYTAAQLDEQLEEQTKRFINDPSRNRLGANKLRLSSIFNWFGSDFKRNGTLVEFLNRYSDTQINPSAPISYLDYNWNLNEQK